MALGVACSISWTSGCVWWFNGRLSLRRADGCTGVYVFAVLEFGCMAWVATAARSFLCRNNDR